MKRILLAYWIFTISILLTSCATTTGNGNAPEMTSNRTYSPAVTQQSYMFRAPSPAVMSEAGLSGR